MVTEWRAHFHPTLRVWENCDDLKCRFSMHGRFVSEGSQ